MTWVWPVISGIVASSAALIGSALILLLVPALHHRGGPAAGVMQVALIGVGVWTIWLIGHQHP